MNTYLPDNRTIRVSFPASVAVAVGDLMYHDGTYAKPASSQTDAGSLALNQRKFAMAFLGISQDQRLSSESTAGDRVVIQDGVFIYACASTTWSVGDLIGAVEDAGGDALVNQTVAKVTNPALAIGVCVEAGTSVTQVKGFFSGRISRDFLLKASTTLGGQQGRSVRTATLAGTDTLAVSSAPIQVLDPGGSGRNVVLPDEAASASFVFYIHNAADNPEVLTIKASDGSTTVCTPTQNETAIVYCDGTTWRGIVGANN